MFDRRCLEQIDKRAPEPSQQQGMSGGEVCEVVRKVGVNARAPWQAEENTGNVKGVPPYRFSMRSKMEGTNLGRALL